MTTFRCALTCIIVFFVSLPISCSAQDEDNKVTIKQTGLEILDEYLLKNSSQCSENRHIPDRNKDAHFNATLEMAPSEAAEIIINEVLCRAGLSGKIDDDMFFLSALIGVNASKLDGSKPVKNFHPVLSIVATWDVYPDVSMAWALTELNARNLPVYGKNFSESPRHKVVNSLSNMSELLTLDGSEKDD